VRVGPLKLVLMGMGEWKAQSCDKACYQQLTGWAKPEAGRTARGNL
jgi:hypothetical protein